MKKIIFLFAFIFTATFISAQSTPACCMKKNTASASNLEQSSKACAGMATAQETNIQKRVDKTTGEVTYFEKSVCSESGTVTWNKISAEEANKKMTKVASVGMEKTATGEVKSTDTKCQGASKSCCKDKKQVN
jgi:hypothetical protein